MTEAISVAEGVEALALNPNEIEETATAEEVIVNDEQNDIVDPWNVTSSSASGIDYDKLISKINKVIFYFYLIKYIRRTFRVIEN